MLAPALADAQPGRAGHALRPTRLSPALPRRQVCALLVHTCAGIVLAVAHLASGQSLTVADLSLTSTVTNSDPTVDDQVTFTIRLLNSGPNTASTIVVQDQLPSGYTYVRHSVTKGSYNPSTGKWTAGSLASGATGKLTLQATVQGSGRHTNVAEITESAARDGDSMPNNHVITEDDYASVSVRPYDFTAAKAVLTAKLSPVDSNYSVIINRGEKQIFLYESGTLNTDSIVAIGSSTKWVSGGVMVSLADQGYFDLEDPISQYVATFNTTEKHDISILHAFSMSSGLYSSQQYQIQPNLTLAQSTTAIALDTPVVFTPGTQIAYDGKGMQAAGRAAELATGIDWRTLADIEILGPCGMTNTHYDNFGTNPSVPGGITTTATDYMKYLGMLSRGGTNDAGDRVLTSRALDWMFVNYTEGFPIYYSYWPHNSPYYQYGRTDPEYGFGYWVLAQTPGTGDVEEVAGPGAYGSFPWIDFSRDIRGIILPEHHNTEENDLIIDASLQFIEAVRNAVDAHDGNVTDSIATDRGTLR